MTKRANHAVFKSRTIGLIDTLKLSNAEIVELAIALAISYSAGRPHTELHSLLNRLLGQSSDKGEVST